MLADGAQVLLAEVDSARAASMLDLPGVTRIDPARALETPCDVFAPCALGGVLSESTIGLLECRAVAGAANNQLSESDDAIRLRDRGILYAPDYIINIGGALAIPGIEKLGWSAAEAERRVRETVEGDPRARVRPRGCRGPDDRGGSTKYRDEPARESIFHRKIPVLRKTVTKLRTKPSYEDEGRIENCSKAGRKPCRFPM